MTGDHFRRILSQHMQAKMHREGLSFDKLSRHLGFDSKKRNWLFRLAHDQDPSHPDVEVPDCMLALLDWLSMQPEDFAERPSEKGHVELAILSLDMVPQQRNQLLDIVRAFFQASGRP